MTPREFVKKWKAASLKERSAAQEHFLDLRELVGHGKPAALDPKGEFFCFERGAEKRGGFESRAVARFLDRVLFAHFAEDIGLLPNEVASKLFEAARRRPELSRSPVIAFGREDDCFFGVLHSRLHEAWALAPGT